MARKISGFKTGEERCIVPTSFDNNTDESPIKVWIKQPTLRQKRQMLSSKMSNTVELDAQGNPVVGADGEPSVRIDLNDSFGLYEQCVAEFVTRVENYEGPNGQIATAQDLVTHGELEILLEVASTILGEGDDETTKKHSASTPPKTQASSGIVGDVESQDSQRSETAAQA